MRQVSHGRVRVDEDEPPGSSARPCIELFIPQGRTVVIRVNDPLAGRRIPQKHTISMNVPFLLTLHARIHQEASTRCEGHRDGLSEVHRSLIPMVLAESDKQLPHGRIPREVGGTGKWSSDNRGVDV